MFRMSNFFISMIKVAWRAWKIFVFLFNVHLGLNKFFVIYCIATETTHWGIAGRDQFRFAFKLKSFSSPFEWACLQIYWDKKLRKWRLIGINFLKHKNLSHFPETFHNWSGNWQKVVACMQLFSLFMPFALHNERIFHGNFLLFLLLVQIWMGENYLWLENAK